MSNDQLSSGEKPSHRGRKAAVGIGLTAAGIIGGLIATHKQSDNAEPVRRPAATASPNPVSSEITPTPTIHQKPEVHKATPTPESEAQWSAEAMEHLLHPQKGDQLTTLKDRILVDKSAIVYDSAYTTSHNVVDNNLDMEVVNGEVLKRPDGSYLICWTNNKQTVRCLKTNSLHGVYAVAKNGHQSPFDPDDTESHTITKIDGYGVPYDHADLLRQGFTEDPEPIKPQQYSH